MALLSPVAGAIISLPFGPVTQTYEFPWYARQVNGVWREATWNAASGFTRIAHFHTALDLVAAAGTPILASETGKVVFAGWDPVAGYKIEVRIRPNVSYASNHCSALLAGVGATVKRGQLIARVGDTGSGSHGAHDHFWVEIDEVISGTLRHVYWNPALFLPGGALADDPRIKPPVTTIYAVIAPKQHIYTAPILDAAHVVARDETKQIELKYLGATTGDDYTYGDGKTSNVWAKLDAGNAAHTVRFVPYYRVKSFVPR